MVGLIAAARYIDKKGERLARVDVAVFLHLIPAHYVIDGKMKLSRYAGQ